MAHKTHIPAVLTYSPINLMLLMAYVENANLEERSRTACTEL
jgi:hypothetical protein